MNALIESPENVSRLEELIGTARGIVRELEAAIWIIGNRPNHVAAGRISCRDARNMAREIGVFYGVSNDELFGKRRTASIVWPRHVAFWMLRKLSTSSLEEIGGIFNRLDHGTVGNGIRNVDNRCELDASTRTEIQGLRGRLERKYCTGSTGADDQFHPGGSR